MLLNVTLNDPDTTTDPFLAVRDALDACGIAATVMELDATTCARFAVTGPPERRNIAELLNVLHATLQTLTSHLATHKPS